MQNRFQDGSHGGHLGFSMGMILAISDLQLAPIHPTMCQVNWPFSSGGGARNIFSRWQPSPLNNFSYF